jgi:hypothetical protein
MMTAVNKSVRFVNIITDISQLYIDKYQQTHLYYRLIVVFSVR